LHRIRRRIRRLRLERRRLTRSWRRRGGLWDGGWSLCCRGHGWFRRRPPTPHQLPPFRKVRGRMGHPIRRVLSSQFSVLRNPAPRFLLLSPTGEGHLKLLTSCRLRLRGKVGTANRPLSSRLTRSSRIRTRRVRSSSPTLWWGWPPRSRSRESCIRSWFGQRHFREARLG